MNVVTRFAPSPTGYLHIGGARTALFNYLFARHHGGTFHLRIEDTDRERSTDAAIHAIIEGMKWLGMEWDGEVVYQFARAPRHAEIARALVEQGKAYYCFATPEELNAMREAAQKEGKVFRYDGRWRDRDPKETPPGIKPVVRLKAPLEGSITVEDQVQGSVTVGCKELDDMVILRSDGTPTYMLAVVVDDHDMGVTHVIRGDDHLTNTFRQMLIYTAMGWNVPTFAHVPMILGPDGAKLSKRHGALGVEAYRDMGYLPEALRNYLLRLGWSHGDDEIISDEQARKWFNLESVGKSPSRFDFAKLENVNGHYIRAADDARLVDLIVERETWDVKGEEKPPATSHVPPATPSLPPPILHRLLRGMNGLKQRAKTLKELAENAKFYIARPQLDEKARAILENGGKERIAAWLPAFQALASWDHTTIEALCKQLAEQNSIKLGEVMQPLRAAITGRTTSPSMFEAMEILGKEQVLERLHIS